MNANRGRNVYTPGSVDSWDMENLNFLRKMRQNGNKNGRQDLDTASYASTSDAESAIYEDRTLVGDLTSEDEKGRHNASIYARRGDDPSSLSMNLEDDSDYGMSSNAGSGSDMQTPTRLLDEALYSGGNGFALLNKSIVMKQMKSMAASTLKDPYLEDEETESESIIQPTTVVRKNPLLSAAASAGGLSRKTSRATDNDSNNPFDRKFMKSRKPKPSLITVGFMEPPLEDCYLLDVMTIRNESVLAERGRGENTRHIVFSSDSQDSESDCTERRLKLNGSNSTRNGSAGLPSSASSTSSVSSSSDDFNSAREGSYFPSPGSPGEDDPIEIHRDSSPEGTRASSCSPVSVVVRGECTATTSTRLQSAYQQSSNDTRSFATASSTYYYLGQQAGQPSQDPEDFPPYEHEDCMDDRSNSNSKDSLRMLDLETPTPRSPSPYYVRLRRDLIPKSYTPPHQRQPWNFGMNRQGLLVIDYSPNWDGLESYVRGLRIQN